MKGIISFFGEPVVLLIIGALIAILVAVVVFGVKGDVLTNLFGMFAPR